MGSHYIKVQNLKIEKDILDILCPAAGYDETPPPPEIYCPAQGFYDPSKPIPYKPDPNIPKVEIDDGEIILVVCDALEAAVALRTTTSAGQVNYSIYGANDTLIVSDNVNSNTVYFKQLPASGGTKLTNGYNAFTIKITAVTGSLLTFICTTHSGWGAYGWPVLESHFKAPSLTSLSNCFNAQKMILYAKFYGKHNDLGSLENFAYQASNFKEVHLGEEMNKLGSLYRAFSYSSLEVITFPDSLSNLRNLSQTFWRSKIKNQSNLPMDLPSLTTMMGAYDDCKELSGILKIPNAPALENIVFLCRNSKVKKVIALSGYAMNVVTAWLSFDGCALLEEIDLSAGAWGQLNTPWVFSPFSGSIPNLKVIKLPTELINLSTDLSRSHSLGSSHSLTERTGTTITGWPLLNITFAAGSKIESVYLPDLKTTSIQYSGTSTRIAAVKSIEIDWVNSLGNINFRYTSLPKEEIDRIFTALPAAVGTRTIDVRNTPGYATCDKTIAQNKGWTVS